MQPKWSRVRNIPTSSCYFHQIWEVKKLLECKSTNSDFKIALMAQKMKEKLQKYWDLCYLQICIPVILDLRFKLSFIEFRLKQGFGSRAFTYFSKVQKTFRKLFDDYSLKFADLIPENARPFSGGRTGTAKQPHVLGGVSGLVATARVSLAAVAAVGRAAAARPTFILTQGRMQCQGPSLQFLHCYPGAALCTAAKSAHILFSLTGGRTRKEYHQVLNSVSHSSQNVVPFL
uniref:hAT-like transposase RNase-H fold domain-containing protein n=1 Tax=Arundo donax TaxID=35708 RepID=A0A0A9GJ51_ARUDO